MKIEKITQANQNNSAENEKKLDENVVEIIKGINFLMTSAKKSGFGSIHNILMGARNDVISWAVNIKFADKLAEKPVADVLFDSGLLYALGIIARYASIKDPQLREEVYRSLKSLTEAGIQVPSTKEFAAQQ